MEARFPVIGAPLLLSFLTGYEQYCRYHCRQGYNAMTWLATKIESITNWIEKELEDGSYTILNCIVIGNLYEEV
jgi:hypothetical protein